MKAEDLAALVARLRHATDSGAYGATIEGEYGTGRLCHDVRAVLDALEAAQRNAAQLVSDAGQLANDSIRWRDGCLAAEQKLEAGAAREARLRETMRLVAAGLDANDDQTCILAAAELRAALEEPR